MQPLKTASLLASVLLASIRLCVAAPTVSDVTTQVTLIALPKAQALKFTSEHHLDSEAAKGFADLQALAERKEAAVAADFAVTTRSGQVAKSESEVARLEIEPVRSPSGDKIDANLQFTYGTKVKISTAILVDNGDVKFLGLFDSAAPDQDMTYLAFVRLSAAK